MSTVTLMTPILSGGIQNVNFVNGRVLTAADLTAERTANLQRQRLLGSCIGSGVAAGLDVTLSPSSVPSGTQVVHVTAGIAVNPNGDVLQLTADSDVTLAAAAQAASGATNLFVACAPPQTQLTNPGIYVLTVMPASGYQGQVPATQLNSAGVATSCISQYATTGVQFRLAQVTLASQGSGLQPALYALANQIQTQLNNNATAASIAPELSQLRNGLAHVCFGTESLAGFSANPFPSSPQESSFVSYGLIDSLRGSGTITNCEVPLALVYWTPGGIQFVDMWAVRRTLTKPLVDDDWPLFVGNRHCAEAEAMFLQFQAQLRDIGNAVSNLSTVSAAQYFYYVPPTGVLPLAGTGGSSGFSYQTFFPQGGFHAPVFVVSTRVDSIIRTAFPYPPVNLQASGAIWLYQPVDGTTVLPYLVFTNIFVPYQGDARFNVASWNFGNFM